MSRNYPEVEFDGLHIGQIIQKTIESKGLEYSWVSKKLSISATGLYHRIKNPTYSDIYDVIKMSLVLETDLLALIYNEVHRRLPKLFSYEILGSNHPENISLQEEMNKLKAENNSLYELIAVLKNNNRTT
jgi:hypothetical protein